MPRPQPLMSDPEKQASWWPASAWSGGNDVDCLISTTRLLQPSRSPPLQALVELAMASGRSTGPPLPPDAAQARFVHAAASPRIARLAGQGAATDQVDVGRLLVEQQLDQVLALGRRAGDRRRGRGRRATARTRRACRARSPSRGCRRGSSRPPWDRRRRRRSAPARSAGRPGDRGPRRRAPRDERTRRSRAPPGSRRTRSGRPRTTRWPRAAPAGRAGSWRARRARRARPARRRRPHPSCGRWHGSRRR